MKHLLLSIDGIIDAGTGKPFSGILDVLKKFKSEDNSREVIVISARGLNLSLIPSELNPIKIPYELRGSGEKLVRYLEKELKLKLDDLIIIGAKASDMQTAAHLKAILLRADYAKNNNSGDTIF